MKRKVWVILGLIVLLAFFLRFYRITEIPPSLNWDEVSIGYNAYSVLKTGRDEWGEFLPLHFKSYGEYKLPVQIYASIPGIAIFGLNELGVRITPVVVGTLTVLVLFFLGRLLFQSITIGLGAAALLAVSPWHIQLTRASFESSLATLLVALGIWFLVKGFKERQWLIWAMIPLGLAVYTYNSARVFVPLFLLSGIWLYRKELFKKPKVILLAFLTFVVMMLPLVPFYFGGGGEARYKLVSITDDPGLIPRINENRGNSTLPDPLPRLIHNKVTYLTYYISEHYLAHFTPDFLFISGAPHKQHHVQGIGELYLFQAPFLLIGLYLLIRRKQQYKGLMLIWLLLAFVPVAVTNDSIPHALRSLIAAPWYQLVTALGAVTAIYWLKKQDKRWLMVAIAIVGVSATLNLATYLNLYYNVYAREYSRAWQYGYKQAVEYVDRNQNKYDLIVFTRSYGEPHEFYAFFSAMDPAKFQNDPNKVYYAEPNNWIRVLKMDKFYFPDLSEDGTRFKEILAKYPNKKILFVGKPGDFPQGTPHLKKVNFLDEAEDFAIVEVK